MILLVYWMFVHVMCILDISTYDSCFWILLVLWIFDTLHGKVLTWLI